MKLPAPLPAASSPALTRRLLLGAAAGYCVGEPASAQSARATRRMGFLHPRTIAPDSPTVRDLSAAWNKLGYRAPETLIARSAGNDLSRLPGLAAEMTRLGVGAVIAVGPAAVLAARDAGMPVVAIDLESDPVRSGLVESLSRPGRAVTGLYLDQPSLAGKWVELLREAAPRLAHLLLIWDPSSSPDQAEAARRAAATQGLSTSIIRVERPDDYDGRLPEPDAEGRAGAILLGAPGLSVGGKRFADAALRRKLPAMAHQRFLAEDGVLISYGPARDTGYWPRAVVLADRILKGEKPADLPIERPPTFELVINTDTARAIGVMIPPTLLARADLVLE